MIQLIKRPTKTAFSRNPIAYQLRAVDNLTLLSYRAVGAISNFVVPQSFFSVDDTLTLSWTDPTGSTGQVIFTATVTPDTDTDIPANTAFSIVAQYINAHRFIAPIFRVFYDELSDNRINAEAKNQESGWTIDWSWSLSEQIDKSFVPFAAMNTPSGYFISYQVFFEVGYNTRKWESIHTGRLFPRDDGGDLYLNISDILDTACRATLKENPFSSYNKILPTQTDNIRRYYVRFREFGTGVTSDWQTESISNLITGGLMNQVWLAQNWFNFTIDDLARTWLTHRYVSQVVYFGKTSWLSWYNPTGETVTVTLRGAYINVLGLTVSFSVQNIQATIEKEKCLTFVVSPDALQLPTNARSYWIEVVTTVGEIPLSTPRYFRIDTNPYRNQRTLAYLNAFGCPETVVCTGENTRQIAVTTTQTEAVRGVNYAGGIVRSERFLQSFLVNYTYRTGILAASQRESLTELGLSDVLFDISGSSYLALILKAETANKVETIFDSSETNYAVEWVATPRINMGAWGADSGLQGVGNLNEPLYRLDGTVSEDGSILFPTDTNDVAPTDFTELATLEESDLIVFAKLNQNGEVAGFYTYQNGKYKRLIRGIPLDAPSHLDGMGIKNAETGVISTLKTDKNGSNHWE